eukprot:2660034-Amphidinium_carterae.1
MFDDPPAEHAERYAGTPVPAPGLTPRSQQFDLNGTSQCVGFRSHVQVAGIEATTGTEACPLGIARNKRFGKPLAVGSGHVLHKAAFKQPDVCTSLFVCIVELMLRSVGPPSWQLFVARPLERASLRELQEECTQVQNLRKFDFQPPTRFCMAHCCSAS